MEFLPAKRWVTAALAVLLLVLWMPGPARADSGMPMAVRLVLYKTGLLLEKKAYAKALEVIEKFQARHRPGQPDKKGYHHPRIYFAKGNCLLMLKDYRAAAAAYRKAVSADAGFSAAWLNLARACYELKRYHRAGEAFARAYLTAKTKKPETLYYSAVAFMLAGDNGRCLEQFEKLLADHGRDFKPAWKENFVHSLLAAGKPLRALPFIRELAATYTGEKQIRWQEILIYQYLRLDMKEAALALVRNLTAQAPGVARWWKALAHLELDGQNYQQALVALVIYSYLQPLKDQERKLLADLYLQVGIPAKAVPAYSACLDKKPHPALVRCLALAYQQLGKPAAALDTIDRFAPKSREPDLLMIRADLLYRLERWDQAAEAFRKVARSDCRHKARAWLMAGYAAWQAGDLEASRKAFKMASRYGRQRKLALAALQQLKEVQSQ